MPPVAFAYASLLIAIVCIEAPSTSDSSTNSCRRASVIWPALVRNSMPLPSSSVRRVSHKKPWRWHWRLRHKLQPRIRRRRERFEHCRDQRRLARLLPIRAHERLLPPVPTQSGTRQPRKLRTNPVARGVNRGPARLHCSLTRALSISITVLIARCSARWPSTGSVVPQVALLLGVSQGAMTQDGSPGYRARGSCTTSASLLRRAGCRLGRAPRPGRDRAPAAAAALDLRGYRRDVGVGWLWLAARTGGRFRRAHGAGCRP